MFKNHAKDTSGRDRSVVRGQRSLLFSYIGMGQMLRISNDIFSEASGPMLLKFHVESPWGRGMKDC